MYDFQVEKVISFIISKNAKVVALQMPEGLKTHALALSDEISSRTGAISIIIGDPCYGACDVRMDHSRYADVLVHFGHAEIPSMGSSDRVLYVEVSLAFEIAPLIVQALPKLGQRVGIITTIQHVGQVKEAIRVLEAHDRKAFSGKGDSRIRYSGQILGCNISSATIISNEVDSFLYMGSGDFHPLSVALETGKPVIIIDPIMNEVRELIELRDKVLRQRHAAIARSIDVRRFGIIVSSKVGQQRMALALDLVHRLESQGRKGDIIMMEEVGPEQLLPYDVGAFVSTACPRLAIDDQMRYPKPMLTPVELEIVMGERNWDNYHLDMING